MWGLRSGEDGRLWQESYWRGTSTYTSVPAIDIDRDDAMR
jgi:hypothetical protein